MLKSDAISSEWDVRIPAVRQPRCRRACRAGVAPLLCLRVSAAALLVRVLSFCAVNFVTFIFRGLFRDFHPLSSRIPTSYSSPVEDIAIVAILFCRAAPAVTYSSTSTRTVSQPRMPLRVPVRISYVCCQCFRAAACVAVMRSMESEGQKGTAPSVIISLRRCSSG
eukprot:scaffold659330_cov98-Prasinocladus_malaysianus.AAC.1